MTPLAEDGARNSRNAAPPRSLSPTSMRQPCAIAIWRARLRPTPVPSARVVKNGRNSRARSGGGNARAVVLDRDHHVRSRGSRSRSRTGAPPVDVLRRLCGVAQQVDQQSARADRDRRRSSGRRRRHVEPRARAIRPRTAARARRRTARRRSAAARLGQARDAAVAVDEPPQPLGAARERRHREPRVGEVGVVLAEQHRGGAASEVTGVSELRISWVSTRTRSVCAAISTASSAACTGSTATTRTGTPSRASARRAHERALGAAGEGSGQHRLADRARARPGSAAKVAP